jgi:hypothetical protein
MSNWKIALAVGALVAISLLVGAVAYANIVSITEPTYSNTAPGAYGNYPSTGNIPYPTSPSYPTQPNTPLYPTSHQATTSTVTVIPTAAMANVKWVHGAANKLSKAAPPSIL